MKTCKIVLTNTVVSVNTENIINKELITVKLELTTTARKLEVYYDGECGMCCSFIEWLVGEDRALEVVCMPYQNEEAVRGFPDLMDYSPGKEIVVRVDGVDIYKGAEGWVWCLWSCAKYRDVAKLMNSRFMLPLAKKACYLLSKNRLRVSKLFFGKKAKQIAEEMNQTKVAEKDCENDNCKF